MIELIGLIFLCLDNFFCGANIRIADEEEIKVHSLNFGIMSCTENRNKKIKNITEGGGQAREKISQTGFSLH